MEAKRVEQDRSASESRAISDGRLKAYSELLNKREESDMGVRSQIFSTLLGNYLNPVKGDLTKRMTVLELLASNFDESLNLNSLFWNIDNEISAGRGPKHSALRMRLSRLANEVKERQMDVLSASGDRTSWDVTLRTGSMELLPEKLLEFDDPSSAKGSGHAACVFKVQLLEWDPKKRSIFAVVRTYPPPGDRNSASSCINQQGHESRDSQPWSFWIDEFDFPQITFSRMSEKLRFSLVILDYSEEKHFASIGLVFFPSSRGGARDRPYLDTVVNSLNSAVLNPGGPHVVSPNR